MLYLINTTVGRISWSIGNLKIQSSRSDATGFVAAKHSFAYLVFKISKATSLALHAMVLMATNPGKPLSTKNIASVLHASENHLAKVLQRLARDNLVNSTRGPKGGFILAKPSEKITLLDIYETIEGRLTTNSCQFDTKNCDGTNCIFGSLLEKTVKQARRYFAETKLSDLKNVYRSKKT